MVLGRYREVLRHDQVARLLLTAIVARLPQGMSELAILLFLTPRLGYGRAGIATGLSVATAGLSNVALTRAIDRVGGRRVIAPTAALYAAAMLALAARVDEPYAAQLAICAAIGLVTPPVTAVSRGMWTKLLSAEQAQVVYGLEATTQELIYISGPAVVALVAGLAGARAAVVVSGAVGFVGALAYVSSPVFAASGRAGLQQLRRAAVGRAVGVYALVAVCLTLGLAMTDIATVDFVSGRHASASAGVVLAVWSAGSLVGGLLFGAAAGQVTDRRLAQALALTGAGLALCAVAPDQVGLAALLALSGLAVAPTMARLYSRIGAAAGGGSTTEAFGWLAVGFLVGSSAGAAVGGLSVDGFGARWTFVLAGAGALCALPVIASHRRVTSRRGLGQDPDPDAA